MQTDVHRKSIAASGLLALTMLLFLTTFVMAANVPVPARLWASGIWTFFLTLITFLIYRTGRISRYRTIFFVIYAAAFLLSFVSNLIEERGSMALTQEIIDANETPLCPVAIPQLLLPALAKNTLIFPTGITVWNNPDPDRGGVHHKASNGDKVTVIETKRVSPGSGGLWFKLEGGGWTNDLWLTDEPCTDQNLADYSLDDC